MTSDLIGTKEALTVLGYSNPSTISRLVASGKLQPATRLPGRTGAFLFNRTDIERLAEELAA